VDPLSKKLLSLLPTDDAGWVVVPIPAHPLRRISRGYNQSELLASAISKESGIPVKMDILRKTKYTERQVTAKTKAERLNRQRNSFKVTGSLPYTNIILIDDVTTTGTTLLEARSCLIKNGASKVLAITVAH
jgi:ComF family protein